MKNYTILVFFFFFVFFFFGEIVDNKYLELTEKPLSFCLYVLCVCVRFGFKAHARDGCFAVDGMFIQLIRLTKYQVELDWDLLQLEMGKQRFLYILIAWSFPQPMFRVQFFEL